MRNSSRIVPLTAHTSFVSPSTPFVFGKELACSIAKWVCISIVTAARSTASVDDVADVTSDGGGHGWRPINNALSSLPHVSALSLDMAISLLLSSCSMWFVHKFNPRKEKRLRTRDSDSIDLRPSSCPKSILVYNIESSPFPLSLLFCDIRDISCNEFASICSYESNDVGPKNSNAFCNDDTVSDDNFCCGWL